MLAYEVGALLIVNFLIGVFTYAVAKLSARRKVQARGDETSPTYAFNGLQTARGSGFIVPIVYGYHPVGGIEIGSAVREIVAAQTINNGPFEPATIAPSINALDILLLLSYGPIEAVADITTNRLGEADNVGNLGIGAFNDPFAVTLWTGLRANGNELLSNEAIASVRLGNVAQTPIRQFQTTQATIDVGASFEASGSTFVVSITNSAADRAILNISFPSGLYDGRTSPPSPWTIGAQYRWRVVDGAWSPWTPVQFTADPVQTTELLFSVTVDFQGAVGPFELALERAGTTGGASPFGVQDRFVLTSVTTVVDGVFEYPGLALLGLTVRATEKLQGATPNFSVACKGRRVRLWVDEETGWVEGWDAVSPWQHPIGQNPAAVFIDVATSTVAGRKAFSDDQLDLEKLRDWADFCDQDDRNGDALLRFDGVLDQDRPLWEWLQEIARAGRAFPVLTGDRLTVVYDYADAHGRGTNVVPARTPLALITQAQVESFSMVYRNNRLRPNFYDVEILDEELSWAKSIIPVEDQLATAERRADLRTAIGEQREGLQMFGVTRREQAIREAHIQHNRNRLSATEITITAGVETLALQPGDLFTFQHEAVFVQGERSWSARTQDGGQIQPNQGMRLDIPVTIPAAGASIAFVTSEGDFEVRTVTNSAGVVGITTPIRFTGSSVNIDRGTPVAIGTTAKYSRNYVVLSATIGQDLKRTIVAEQWDAAAFTVDASLLEDFGADNAGSFQRSAGTSANVTIPDAVGIALDERQRSTKAAFRTPAKTSGRSRVYARTPGSGGWVFQGEGLREPREVAGLVPHKPYEIAVSVQDVSGNWQDPAASASVTVEAPEFVGIRPPGIERLRVQGLDVGFRLSWRPIEGSDLDFYEVRRGQQWLGAEVVGQVRQPWLESSNYGTGSQTYIVRARGRNGLYGQSAKVSFTGSVPGGTSSATSATDLVSGASGTASNVSWDGSFLQLSDGARSGTYVKELSAGSVARRWWCASFDRWEIDLETTAASLTYLVGSNEGLWHESYGRPASLWRPGVDFDELASEVTTATSAIAEIVSGRGIRPGAHTRIVADMRFNTADGEAPAEWSGWEPYRTGYRSASGMQVRLTFQRRNFARQARAANLRIETAA